MQQRDTSWIPLSPVTARHAGLEAMAASATSRRRRRGRRRASLRRLVTALVARGAVR